MERDEVGQRLLDGDFFYRKWLFALSRPFGQRAGEDRQRPCLLEAQAGVEPPRGGILRQHFKFDRSQAE